MLFSTTPFTAKAFSFLTVAALVLPALALAQAPTVTTVISSSTKPGNTITVYGTNLGTTTAVTINGLTMPILSKTITTVAVRVPYEASTGKVRVTNPSGTALSPAIVGVNRNSSSFSFPQVTSTASPLVTISNAAGGYSTPTITDLNQDGILDLVVGNGNGTLTLYPQSANKATTFAAGTLLQLSTGGNIAVSKYAKPTFADLDGNGLLDLLVGENYGTVQRFEQSAVGATTFVSRGQLVANPYGTISGTQTNTGMFARPAVVDLDGNGLLDLLVGSYDGQLHRYEQTVANGTTFAASTPNVLQNSAGTAIAASNTSKPLIMDLDGNGKLDLLLGNFNGDLPHYEQTASNGLAFNASNPASLATNGSTTIGQPLTGNYYSAPVLTDLNQDGLIDLIMGGNSTNNNTAGTASIQLFQQAAAAQNNAPLPVVLTAFTGQATSAGNQLAWATASEQNSASFVVERSADGVTFARVSELAAGGNTATARSYQYLDAAAPVGTSYYRLRQLDLDGTASFSPTVVVSRPATTSLGSSAPAAFPSPFTDALSLTLAGADTPQPATVALLTLEGRTVYSQQVSLSATPQALSGLPALAPGLYLLRTTTAAGTTTQRLSRN